MGNEALLTEGQIAAGNYDAAVIRALLQENRELKAALLAERERKWQPIETAPKDDAEVLLWIPEEEGVEIGFWRSDAGAWDTYQGWLKATPTHWMPLPTPPAAAAIRKESD